MHFLKLSSVFAFVGLTLAAPVSHAPITKREEFNIGSLSPTPPNKGFGVGEFGSFNNLKLQVNDVNILQFALMLEISQTLFYQKAFSQFSVADMLSVGLSQSQIIEFQNSFVIEQTHVNTIVTVLKSLGVAPLPQPKFFFSFSSVVDFVTQLSIQEVVGTGAYLGAAPFVSNKDILGAAASIMAVEARQSSFVNSVLGINAFSAAFETPLSIEQVVSLVSPAIVSIPPGTVLEALGFNAQAFRVEQIDLKAFVQVQINVNINFSYVGGSPIVAPQGVNQLFCAFTVGSSTVFTPFTPGQGCKVSPEIISGSVANLQVTVAKSIASKDVITAPAFITVV